MLSNSLRGHIIFLSTLSIASDSLTRRQRKTLLSHGWRINVGHVIMNTFIFKVLRKSNVQVRIWKHTQAAFLSYDLENPFLN